MWYMYHTYMYETLGLSMELNDDILVQTTPLQTIARVKRVKCFMLHKVPVTGTLKDVRVVLASFAPICMGVMVCGRFHARLTRHTIALERI